MDRFGPVRSLVAVVLVAGGLLAVAAGCNAVATAWWVIKDGKTYPAEYKGLNGKKVAVVVRGPQSGMFRQAQNMPYQLTRNINRLLKENLSKKTQIVSADRIDKVIDSQDWEDFVEVGRQVGAEQVVAIEVDGFRQSLLSTAYSGEASLSISVFDVEKDGEEVYGPKSMRDLRFPPTMEAMPAGNMSGAQFTELFVAFLADNIARNFYDHDPRANFAGYGIME
ncbi:MAG: hypothetical protein DCC68_11885 [Planctomycetota bacterium]|nr:MAG: hypothetical protein DCC68_11885 [Planctomycetota bacterium]